MYGFDLPDVASYIMMAAALSSNKSMFGLEWDKIIGSRKQQS
jgi:hypothetical protein